MLRSRDSQHISFVSLNWLAATNICDETVLNNDETVGDKSCSLKILASSMMKLFNNLG